MGTVKFYLSVFMSALLVLLGVKSYTKGRKDATNGALLDDYENAEDIRRRVSVDRADSVRRLDGAGWRD